ncbi:hypothetical protein SB751_34970, partial [Cupriavidus sp. SIMBA_020]|uniref:hypothetical protein n=1 Tax=Cupriavidus sp. SIMBA_020 TaxID=3085766 RepID=UPI00397CABED
RPKSAAKIAATNFPFARDACGKASRRNRGDRCPNRDKTCPYDSSKTHYTALHNSYIRPFHAVAALIASRIQPASA